MKNNAQKTSLAAIIAALYCVLSLVVPYLSFGTVQFRFSEILTILPIFTPVAIPGLAVGCFITNLVGYAISINPAGFWDIIIGSLTTLVAAVLTYYLKDIKIKGLPVLATLPPVILNAAIIGLELSIVFMNELTLPVYWAQFVSVALGQIAMCTVGGLVFYKVASKTKLVDLLSKYTN